MKPMPVRTIRVRACPQAECDVQFAPRPGPFQDWTVAERERSLLPIAGLAQDGHAFHIDTCVPPRYADDIAVDAFPSDIVVEAARGGHIEGFTRFHLPVPIEPKGVRASMRGIHLEIVAPKAAAWNQGPFTGGQRVAQIGAVSRTPRARDKPASRPQGTRSSSPATE